MSDLINIGSLLIGAALGLLIAMLVDWFWWRNRRICTDDEIRLRGEVEGLKSNELNLQGQISGFETERADWNTRFASMDGELEGYRGKLGQFETENGDLKTRLGKFESDNALYLGRLKEFETRDADLTTRLSGLQTDNESLQAKLGKLETDNNTLSADIGKLRTGSAELETKLAAATDLNTSLKAQLADFETEKSSFQTRLGDFESKNVALAASLSALESDKLGLQGQIGDFDTERQSFEAKLGGLEAERGQLQARIGELEGANADLSARIGALDSEKATLESRVADFSGGRDALEAQLRDLEGQNLELRNAAGGYEGEITSLKAELADLRASAESNTNPGLMMATGAATAGAVGFAASGADDEPVETIEVAAAPEADDLKKIWGIGPASERVLNANGIYTFAQLCASDSADLEKMLNDGNLNASILSEETWPEQACLAKDGKWDELSAMQSSLKAASGDDLQSLFGLGPKSEQILYGAGIYKFSQLCKATPERLAEILEAAEVNAALMNEESWPQQACLAADGDMEGLAKLQSELKAEQADDFSKIYGLGPKSISILQDNDVYKYGQLARSNADTLGQMLIDADVSADLMNEETWPKQAELLAAGKLDELAAYQATLKNTPKTDDAAASTSDEPDDLKTLWGIGPASEAVLNANGISSYSSLANADVSALTGMLSEADGSFALVREDTWPEQARLALAGDTSGLATMQETLSAEYVSRTIDVAAYDGEKDDLTRCWGIGPAVQKVLHSKGIFTFSQLAGTQLTMLQGIITAAGERFNLVKPELWIPQAELLAAGDTDGFNALRKRISAENS